MAAPARGLPAAARMRVRSRAGLFILTGEREPRQGHVRDESRGEGDRALVEPPAEILPHYSDSAVIRA